MDGKNWITGYAPVSIDIRHFASTFEEKQRDLKQKEKEYFASLLDTELYKIKNQSINMCINVISESYYSQICDVCFKNEKSRSSDNYYINLLDVDQLLSLRNTRTKYFKNLRFFLTINTYSVNCSSKLFRNKELLEFLGASAAHYEKNESVYHKKPITYKMLFGWMKKAVKSFAFTFSSFIFKIVGTCWYTVSHSFAQRLIVSSAEIKNLKEVNENDRFPFVYVLKNQSKFDWLLTLFVLFFCKLKIPVILLRKSSNSKLNWLYRQFGVVFMPRHKTYANVKRDVQMETWLIYLEENLKIGNHLLFYLEGEKDDTFILETLIDSVRRNVVEDILVSPVNINYEKKVDKFADETVLGGSLWTKIINVYRKKVYNFGFVNVTFHRPFPLRELISSLGNELQLATAASKIICHLNFDFCRSQVLLPTNLICFLLLKKFRNGVKFDNLVREVDELYWELIFLKKRVRFTGNTENFVNHVIKLLGPTLIVVDSNTVKPVLELPNVLELANYADEVLHTFILDAIIMTTVAMLFKYDLEAAFKGSDKELKFYYMELIEKSEQLCEILQFEYVFEKPCKMYGDEMKEVLFKFISNNYFTKEEKMLTEEEQWSHRFARHLEESDSEESDDGTYSPTFRRSAKDMGDSYTINLDNEKPVLREILFYKNTIKPLLDTYIISAENLNTLVGKQMTASAYYKKLLNKMKIMLDGRQLEYSESVSLTTIKNSMKLFEKLGVVEKYSTDGIEIFYLSQQYNAQISLLPIVDKIKAFQ